ncbi:MAG: hypothetical protein ABIP51_22650 [Bacteroidia bacterium]
MKISYNFPSRSRPDKCFKAIENILSLSRHDDFEIIITADMDDSTMCNNEVRDKLNSYLNTRVIYGNSKTKVEAVNQNAGLATGDIICTHSDDMTWIKEGFDLDILEGFSDGFRGLLHFPDQVAKEHLITYPIMHKDYYKIDNFIYHPDFISVYCDNFQQYIAKSRNQYKFVNKQILEHRHAIWGFGEKDALLLKTEDPVNYAIDKQTLIRLTQEFNI